MPPRTLGCPATACTGQCPLCDAVTSVRPFLARTGPDLHLTPRAFVLNELVAEIVTFVHDQDDFVHWTTVLVCHVKKDDVRKWCAHVLSHLELSIRPSAHLGWTGLDRIHDQFCIWATSLFWSCVYMILFASVRPPIWAGPDWTGFMICFAYGKLHFVGHMCLHDLFCSLFLSIFYASIRPSGPDRTPVAMQTTLWAGRRPWCYGG